SRRRRGLVATPGVRRCCAVDLQQLARIEKHIRGAVGRLQHLDLEGGRRLTGVALSVWRADVLLDRQADCCRVTWVAPVSAALAAPGGVQGESAGIARAAV